MVGIRSTPSGFTERLSRIGQVRGIISVMLDVNRRFIGVRRRRAAISNMAVA